MDTPKGTSAVYDNADGSKAGKSAAPDTLSSESSQDVRERRKHGRRRHRGGLGSGGRRRQALADESDCVGARSDSVQSRDRYVDAATGAAAPAWEGKRRSGGAAGAGLARDRHCRRQEQEAEGGGQTNASDRRSSRKKRKLQCAGFALFAARAGRREEVVTPRTGAALLPGTTTGVRATRVTAGPTSIVYSLMSAWKAGSRAPCSATTVRTRGLGELLPSACMAPSVRRSSRA